MKRMNWIALFCMALSATGSMAAERLVTLTGEIDPQYSLEISPAEKERIQKELEGLGSLEPITIDVNELFIPGDEEAIHQASNQIARTFLAASEILVDLRLLVYRYEAVVQTIQDKDLRERLKATYEEKFTRQHARFQKLFAELDEGMIVALESCVSEMCANQITMVELELIEFGRALNKSAKKLPRIKNPLLRAAIEDMYGLIKDRDGMVKSMFGAFVGMARTDKEKTDGSLLPNGGEFEFRTVRVSKVKYEIAEDFTREILQAKLNAVLLGEKYLRPSPGETKSERKARLLKEGYRHGVSLFCDPNYYRGVAMFAKWAFFLFGKSYMTCKSTQDEYFDVEITTVGPGFKIGWEYAYIQIMSPALIDGTGVYVGLGADASLMIGAEVAAFGGTKGSVATLTGFNLAAFGASSGVQVMKITNAE